MGEVYLATDTRLDRQVAIKALPIHLSQDPDRLARFQREAKVLASLNHPGIGAIYGLEEAEGHVVGTGFEVHVEYLAAPTLENKVLILCDPMLATGSSLVLTHQALKKHGTPLHTHIASIIASTEGIEYVRNHLPENVTIWCAAIDKTLNSEAYIVPGLGDAGDLAYGDKL